MGHPTRQRPQERVLQCTPGRAFRSIRFPKIRTSLSSGSSPSWARRARRCSSTRPAVECSPTRSEAFKRSNDPLLIEQVRDIVGLYMNSPAHAAVCCVDEKPQIQALDCTQPLLPMQRGQVERRTHNDTRHGTTTLFAEQRLRKLTPEPASESA